MDEDQQQNSAGDSQFNRTTAGTRIESELNHLELEAEANVQVGKTNFTQDIFAYYLIGSANYNFDPDKKSQVSIGMDYLSGDKPGTDKYECFNTLYRANHKFFGFMDYFTDIPKHTKNLGLTDIMAKAKITPWEKISLSGDFHLFQLSQSAILNNGSSSKELGSEIDLTFSYNYLKMVNFTLGSSVFMPGKVYKEWKGKDPAWWFYAQTTVNL